MVKKTTALQVISAVQFNRAPHPSSSTVKEIRSWLQLVENSGKVPDCERQKRKSRPSFDAMHNVEFVAAARAKLDKLSKELGPSDRIEAKFEEWVNGRLEKTRSSKSIRRFMRTKCDMEYVCDRKGAYTDGHDRPDVVKDREEFIKKWRELEPRMVKTKEIELAEGEALPSNVDEPCSIDIGTSKDGKRIVSVVQMPSKDMSAGRYLVPVWQDEVTFHANDGRSKVWKRRGSFRLKKKNRGSAIMVSGFMCPCHGEWEQARLTLEVGKHKDGYFNSEKFVAQVEKEVLEEFRRLHPQIDDMDAQGVFVFDHSTGHQCFKPDALVATHLNLKEGGSQPALRDGWVWVERNGKRVKEPFKMVNEDGIPKGARQVLKDRGLWRPGLRLVCKDDPKMNATSCRKRIKAGMEM